ncbi:MAG: acetate--CoA ligase family protein [Candidatus Aenigmatarchaeota archaeon]
MPLPEQVFSPSSIAVIGASKTPDKIGYFILENLKMSFKGDLYPINPTIDQILGLKAYPSITDVENPVDMAVIAVRAELVPAVLAECVKKKVKAAVVISAGFAEIGEREKEEELKRIAKGKLRFLGPNCLGIYSKELDMLFLPRKRLKRPPEGPIGVITQSGAVGTVLLDVLSFEGVGVSKFVSYGNAADINETDLLEYFAKELGTRCIALYIEDLKDGRRFLELCQKLTKSKPVVALKGGKTKPGLAAVSTHIGAIAGQPEVYSAVFKQAGIIEAQTIHELFDYSKALADQPSLKDRRIAVVTNGGGFGIIAADALAKEGLEVPELSKETAKALKAVVPAYSNARNPVDLIGDSNSERYEQALQMVFKDPAISGVLCCMLFQSPTLDDNIVDVLKNAKIYGKPVVVCAVGGEYSIDKMRKLEAYGIPVYPSPERAAKAMKALHAYSEITRKK